MKYKTVREGTQAVVYNHLGEGRIIIGPQRIFLFRERLHLLKQYSASQFEYLQLKDKNGIVTHDQGPCEVFENPLLYDSVNLVPAWKVDANHMIIVYKTDKDSNVKRRIIQGPTVFVPEAEEWLHQFSWHGMDPEVQGRMIPGKNSFTQLSTIPDHFYYNVRDVRTNDDTMITIKLMLFYMLTDVLEMLDSTKDPVSDMINAVCADVIAFTGKLSFVKFLEQTHLLNDLDTYSQLKQRSARIGFTISKVVYRGYHSSTYLQSMQNDAIESRTQMRLDTEIEGQKQKLTDFKLSKEQDRLKLKQSLETSRQVHQQKVEELTQTHRLKKQQLEHSQSVRLHTEKAKAKLDHKSALNEHQIDYLSKVKKLEVDLTKYLSVQTEPPVSEEIQITAKTKNKAKTKTGSALSLSPESHL